MAPRHHTGHDDHWHRGHIDPEYGEGYTHWDNGICVYFADGYGTWGIHEAEEFGADLEQFLLRSE